ncbi:nuclear pore complex assembly-domain-containing protein [Bombardia bombarda]|uniref:Nuclear pore complex assembly-domain-containing protein n=1 Tax=Bombardia bombarda TaxID=252184 RepID=A0AA40C4Q4_9PEZI|nr:nuclear pore complex assembly-domain-containing protein [Bombardia bombarda]
MFDYTQFQAAFPSEGAKPYDPKGVRAIETCRKAFDGALFIDRVLKALNIDDGKAYPPKGDSGLRSLHHQICESKVSSHHKLSVLYYMLLDYDDVRGARSQLAESLAQESGLPAKYQILMRGLWHMDRKEFQFALEHLAHPSLPSEFADDIIIALPVFRRSEALELLFGALARTSVTDALYFIRAGSYPDATRQQLFEKLVASVVLDDDHGNSSHRAKELVSLSLNGEEEKWLADYVTVGEGKNSKNARVLAQMRQIVTGRDRSTGFTSESHPFYAVRSFTASQPPPFSST